MAPSDEWTGGAPHFNFAYELVTLLAVLDPTAAIPVFLAMTAGLSRKQSLLVATYAVENGSAQTCSMNNLSK